MFQYTLSKNTKYILLGTFMLLCIPLISMQFTTEVNWTFADFFAAFMLLFGFGMIIDLVTPKLKTRMSRIVAIVVVTASFVILWAELAVGLFGSPFAGS